MIKKLLTWGGIVVLIFFVAFRPGDAGELLVRLGRAARTLLEVIASFFASLVS